MNPTTITPARLSALSDGIIAIAATLLVLDIRAPVADAAVWPALGHEWPSLAGYVVSFLIIGIAWIHHHNLFHQVRAVDRTLLLLNLGMLLTIGFLPVPTATVGEHLVGGHDATGAAVFYGAALTLTSMWFTLLWQHLYRHPELMHPGSADTARRARRTSLVGPAGYLAATLLALATPIGSVLVEAGLVVWFVVGRAAPSGRTGAPATGADAADGAGSAGSGTTSGS
ncbi:hypothetical protein Athai_22560 [Actinocatenispora thailandica]|uniref:DUF1211 domain-containing protein n=1 Tax=Actinocatenispora thailandica TaxID=227318 RepID=A0A7R7DN90_9ACTN|nr:TMEM175 family protein [Actinocatenispora thailandica]BCJ34753.1 hypothetical protein Athai_22560 [Actinocatenispora thailandica]